MRTLAPKENHLHLDAENLRPSERVTRYLLQEFDNPDIKHGSRLPSNRELAQRLQVSVPTIQSVLRKLSQEGRVHTRRGSGTFLISRSASATPNHGTLKIMVAAQFDQPNAWLQGVFGGFMPAILRSPQPVTLSGLSAQEYGTDASLRRLLDECKHSDALVIIPYVLLEEHRELLTNVYEKAGKAVVYLHPPTIHSTRSFISPDYLGICQRLGRVWKKTGRRNIIMMGEDYENVIATQLQYMGLVSGLEAELGNTISLRTLQGYFPETKAHAAIEKILKESGSPPDAIYTPNLLAAAGVMRALREHGLRIPDDVSVVALEPQPITSKHPGLTLFRQPEAHRMGELLVDMLFKCIEKREPLPGTYLPVSVVTGDTTRPEENALLSADA